METTQTHAKPQLNNILVPIDYSDCSILAIRFAAKMAKKSGAILNLFHAFYSPAYDLIELTGDKHTQEFLRKDITSKLIQSEKEQMEQLLSLLEQHEEVRSLEKQSIRYELWPGLPKDCIIEYAGQTNPDLVIMGTRGQEKKQLSLLGSTTEIVMRKLPFPVMAIPEEYSFELTGIPEQQNIMYLTDFDESDFLAIKHILTYAKILNLNIHCLHLTDKVDKAEEKKLEGLRKYFESAYGQPHFVCQPLLKGTNYVEAIDKYAIEKHVNLIALTTKKRKLYEKVFRPNMTKKLFYHTTIPLLVFHS